MLMDEDISEILYEKEESKIGGYEDMQYQERSNVMVTESSDISQLPSKFKLEARHQNQDFTLDLLNITYDDLTEILRHFERSKQITKASDFVLNMDFTTDSKIFTAIGYKRLPELNSIDLRSIHKLKNRIGRFFEFNLPAKCHILSINTFSNHPEKIQISLFLQSLVGYFTN
jgi:hypothetical protein